MTDEQHEWSSLHAPAAATITLPPGALPPDLDAALGDGALLLSLERLEDGRVVAQTLPAIDPRLVARIRKVMAQHADVLRRLT